VDEDICDFLVAKKAIHTLTYLQFSDNLLIRAAATECLCNMISNPDVAEYIAGSDKVRLWINFAETFEDDDTRLASAAAGGLATLAKMDGWQYKEPTEDDDGVLYTAKRMLDAHAIRAMLEIIDQSNDGGLEHRAIACLSALCDTEDNSARELALKEVVGRSGKAILARLRGADGKNRQPAKRTPDAAKSMASNLLQKLRGVKVDANDYARFSKIDDGSGNNADSLEEDIAAKQIRLLSEYLPESEQKLIVDAESPEEKGRLLQEAVGRHPELRDAIASLQDPQLRNQLKLSGSL